MMREQRCASAAWVSMAASQESATRRDGGLSNALRRRAGARLGRMRHGTDRAGSTPDDGFLIADPVRPPTNRPTTTRLSAADRGACESGGCPGERVWRSLCWLGAGSDNAASKGPLRLPPGIRTGPASASPACRGSAVPRPPRTTGHSAGGYRTKASTQVRRTACSVRGPGRAIQRWQEAWGVAPTGAASSPFTRTQGASS